MHEHCGHHFFGSEAPSFPLPGATEHYAADRPLRAEHVRIEVDLDFATRSVRGTCTTRVKAVREVRALTFDAVDMDIEAAEVDGRRVNVTSTGRQVHLALPKPLAPDASAEVLLRYRCQPSRGLYFFAPDEGYPERPVQAWTQGQDEDARAWFPCLDAPAQKARTEVLATFPAKMTALSNGGLVADTVKGDRRTMHYRFDFPHAPYLVTLVVGELEQSVERRGEVEYRYLYPPGRKDDAMRVLARTPEMVRLFEDLTGQPYPYGSYAQVFVTEFIFGAMENTSATSITDFVMHDARAHQDYSAEYLVAHELAHQWFGDLLTCRDWPHGWLNEGFASYWEVLWKEHAEGPDEGDQARREHLDEYLEECHDRYTRAIVARKFHQPIELFDAHLYQKGALVLHELRRRLGDEVFFKGLRHYVAKHRWGAVETVDLARAFEEVTGHNLDRFFDQYVFAPGHPELKVKVRYEAEKERLAVEVKQAQKVTGPEAWPVFHLPLSVRVVAGGKASVHALELTDAEHTFQLACAEPPTQVVVDPRREVLGTLEVDKPAEYWIEELARAPEARARLEAALALGKDGSRRAVEALARALPGETFWATQAACAKALGQVRTPSARQALLDNLKLPHPKARRAVVAALGEFRRDAEVEKALRRICEAGDPSYYVEGEAARSLGKLRLPGALLLLSEVVKRRSFQEVVASGAVDGMAASLEPAAFPVVREQVAYGKPHYLRRAAIEALAKLAEAADKKREAVEVLADLLRDSYIRVVMSAIKAAETLGDRRMIGPLETTPFSDGRLRRAAKEVIRSLREGQPQAKEVAALREEMDQLKEETRRMKERLEGLEGPARAPVKVKVKKKRVKRR